MPDKTRRLKPDDYVGDEPVMCMLSKARAMAWTLEQLGEPGAGGNNLVHAVEGAPYPEDTLDWLHSVAAEALHAAHDEIEREYRKLGTNLLQKEAETLTPKDGV